MDGSKDIARVGAVSSGDEKIGTLIAEAMEKVSADGVITIEESKTCLLYTSVIFVGQGPCALPVRRKKNSPATASPCKPPFRQGGL